MHTRLAALLAVVIAGFASPAAAQVVLDGPLPSFTTSLPARGRDVVSAIVIAEAPAPVVDRAAVRRELARARAQHLRQLRAYARAESFPINDVQPGMLNVVMDDAGHICAAANLMALDGQLDLVHATAQADNFVRFVDVHDGAVYEWILASGFTREEIGRIQEPYSFLGPDLEGPSLEEQRRQERARVRNVLLTVARELRAQDAVSLELATDRLIAYRFSRSA